MFEEQPDRGPPTSLRGWLSDVYLPVLLDEAEGSLAALTLRLGERAAVDDPIFGRASGLPALERFLDETSKWLKEHKASFARGHFTTGVDRDVTEGVLSLTFDDKTVELPIAVVAERRRSREVELRVYYTTAPIKGTLVSRSPLVAPDQSVVLPQMVVDHLDALRRADVDALLAGFETDGHLREARGVVHKKGAGLREYYEKLCAGPGGVDIVRGGAADDGRTCALEYTLVKIGGRAVAPQAGLAIYERGESGLVSALRIYDDLES